MVCMISRVWNHLWRFKFFRFGVFHVPAGTLNYLVAFLLYWYYGIDKYVATITGHVIHVTLGFFYDRDVTFRAQEKRGLKAWMKYWINDVVSLCSILLTIYVVVDLWAIHLIAAQYLLWSEEKMVVLIRAVPAMIIGTSLTYTLNKFWTFNETSQQSKLV